MSGALHREQSVTVTQHEVANWGITAKTHTLPGPTQQTSNSSESRAS